MSEHDEARVTGRVAQIVSLRDLILNRGSDHGVAEGMIFKVLDGEPGKIEDPETGEVLGEIRRVKVLVKVVDVSARFCVARTFRSRRVNVGGENVGGVSELSKLFQPPKYEWLVETLERNPKQREIEPARALVKIGDPVESLLSTEHEDDMPSIAIWE
ncbi:hypothetical protein AB0N38_01225 [Micromonospora aurantiaca]|uniref:hypothetical protein n=1 Tax=Micromonospora aurantiaca (nom. illeg.) TaxID=47850 RepID=UPI003419753A